MRLCLQHLVLIAAAASLTSAGCRGPTRGIKDPSEMKRVIVKEVPIVSPLEGAQRFMEREGFQCSIETNSSFVHIEEGREVTREGIDYLWCDRSEGGILVQRRWQVAVVFRDGKVTEVLANTGLVGP